MEFLVKEYERWFHCTSNQLFRLAVYGNDDANFQAEKVLNSSYTSQLIRKSRNAVWKTTCKLKIKKIMKTKNCDIRVLLEYRV